jgi:hypothetical protein
MRRHHALLGGSRSLQRDQHPAQSQLLRVL